MNNATRILIVEDYIHDYELAKREIIKAVDSCVFQRVETKTNYLQALDQFQPDLIVCDYNLPTFDGLKALKLAQQHLPSAPVIIWTGSLSEDVAVECMKQGASNYVIKDRIKRLGPAVVQALKERKSNIERKQAEAQIHELLAFNEKVLHNSPIGIITYKVSGECIFANENAAAIVGTSVDALKSQNFHTIASWKESGLYDMVLQVIETKTMMSGDFHPLSTFGKDIWMTVHCVTFLSNEEEHVLLSISDITAREQAEAAEREQRALAEALRDTSQILSGSLEYGEVLDQILASVGRVVPHNAGTIMLVDEGFAHVVRAQGYGVDGWKDQILGIKLPVSGTINLQQILATGQTVIVPDTHEYEGWQRFPITEWLRSSIGSPITIYGEIIGFICLDSDTPNFFTPAHVERLEAFADQAAVAIHNARLLQQAQDEIQERKRAEHALRESEQRYRTIFENSPISIWEEDFSLVKAYIDSLKQQGVTDFRSYLTSHPEVVEQCGRMIRVMDVNNVGLQMYKAANKKELLEGTNGDFSEGEREHNHEDFIAIAEGRTGNGWEGMDTTMDGESLEISLKWSVAPGHEQDYSRVYVTVVDITERKRVEYERQAVLEIMQGLANTKDLDDFLKLVHIAIGNVIYAENFFVVLHQRDRGWFEEIYSVDQYDPPSPPSKLEKSITSYVFRVAEPLLLTRERIQQLVEQEDVELVGTLSASWLGVPLKTSNGTIGVIVVQDYENPNRYSENDKDFLASIASQIALAVERKQAEKELKNAREFLQGIQNSLSAHIVILDQQGVVVQVNKAWRDFAEQNDSSHPAYYVGCNYLDICEATIGPDSEVAQQVAVAIREILAGRQKEISVEYACPSPLEQRWFNALITCFDNGEQKWAILAHENITKRKLAELSVIEKTTQFHTLFEASPDAIILIDPHDDWPIVDCNSAACKMNGYGRDELIGRSIDILNPNRDAPQERVSYLESIKAHDVLRYESRHITKDGTIIEIEVSTTLIQLGGHDMVLGIDRDITERKRAEQELRLSEERFRQLATNIEELFWMTDAQTHQALYVSPAVETIWGMTSGHFINTPHAFVDSVMVEDRATVTEVMKKQSVGEKTEMEYRIMDADGSIRWIWDRAFPIFDNNGRVVRVAGIAADITRRKQSEMEIQRYLTELQALYENGLSISRLLEPKEIGDHIIQTFARYLFWHHAAIRLLNPATGKLELIAFNQPGISDEARVATESRFNKMVSELGQGLSGWVMQTGKPLRTGNVHTHPQYVDTHEGIMSGLYMPLNVGDQTIGCISVESEALDAFSAQDERLLATLANQAAIAFENARLYQAAQLEISERRRAQQALWVSESHYRELADSITDILFELDHELRYTHWNKASEMFSGIPAEDAIGRSIREVFGDSQPQIQREAVYKSVLEERQARIFETEIMVRGQKRYLEINAYPSARGVSVVAKDVSARKLVETLLHKRLELIDYSAHHSFTELMQKTIDEVSGLTDSHIGFLHFVEEDEKTVNWQIWSSETINVMGNVEGMGMHFPVDGAGIWADAVRQRRAVIHNDYESIPDKAGLPEGHIKLIRELVIPILRNEKIVAVMGIGNKPQPYTQSDIDTAERFADYAWDVIERKRMESALADERNQLAQRVEERTADLSRANSNLARALRVKDEFLANMSHELRTPLNAILGLSESLAEQVAGPLNEKQQKYLSTINESGHHLLALINDILDLAKIEAGQITLDINKVDVNSVCQASLRMVRQLAQRKNQEVSFEIDNTIGLMWADERRLKQMIVNLLSNAVKFTPDSGKLGLEVRGDKAGNKVIITVWDNGIGISENDMQRLFKPFVQLDAGLAREATGTGLGLALVAQMARLHGGSVTVESQVEHGSRFTIRLPWEPALAGEANSRLKTTGKFRAIRPNEVRPTLLLIEDTHEVVMILVDYLEMAGFNMITAQDGIDGLTQARLFHPSLILMDVQMPRMDGFETTRKLRNDPEFRDTPIIALTALAMPNDRERCMEAGMNEYLSKPVNLKSLVKTIKTFLYNTETDRS